MYRYICTAFVLALSLFFLSDVSAGSNGDAPLEGQDWIITQDTHVWDDDVNVKNILVTNGKTLKLENVSLNSIGSIRIHGETIWLNSSIFHDKRDVEDNISLYSKLQIISTELLMNATDSYDGNNANVFYVSKDAELVVRDYDNDETTLSDRSVIKGLNSHIQDFDNRNNHSISIGNCVKKVCSHGSEDPELWYNEAKFSIKNSYFENIYGVRLYGRTGQIESTHFNNIGFVSMVGNNTLFSNNLLTNSWIGFDLTASGTNININNNTFENGTNGVHLWSCAPCGWLTDEALIENNQFLNYNQPAWGSSVALQISDGNNHTVQHNTFKNISNHAFRFNAVNDTVFTGNTFERTGLNAHTGVVKAGFRNDFNNNTFMSF